jgi:plasmid maintenance system killer protein
VILSYRDERTSDFARGKRVKALSGIERSARLKLDRLEAATSKLIWLHCPAIDLKRSKENAKGNTAFGSITMASVF